MAEVVGIVSAGIGVAAFAHQITTHIYTLRSIRKFNRDKISTEVKQLWTELECLEHISSVLQHWDFPAARNPPLANNLKEICTSLQQLVQKVEGSQRGRWDRLKSGFSREAKEDMEELRGRIGRLRSGFILSVSVQSLVQHRPCPVPTQLEGTSPEPSAVSLLEDSSSTTVEPEQSTIALHEPCHDSEPGQTLPQRISKITPPSSDSRLCHCSCHIVQQFGGRTWYLQYTPISAFLRNCDNQWCAATRIRLAARLSLWNLGLPWAVSGCFEFLANNKSYNIRPALSITSVVPYTAPVFETLWNLQHCQISLLQAKEKLIELNEADPSIASHVNPSGEDCIQVLLSYGPWLCQDEQFEILLLLINEFGVSLKGRDQSNGNRFLTRCAWWIGEGRHLDLLDCILRGGFDLSLIDSPLFEQWPVGCSSNWINEQLTPDPFFVEYLATIARSDNDFAGVHPVHQVVLSGSVNRLEDFISRSTHPLEDSRTFLGQTALHLAVDNIELVRILVKAGHAIDVIDEWGVTPLMYASARCSIDTTELLISEGANLATSSEIEDRDFLDFALLRGNHNLAIQTLKQVKSKYGRKPFELFSLKAILRLIGIPSYNWDGNSWEDCFDFLVRNCGNINFTFGDSYRGTELNNFMHYVKSTSAAKTLIQLGYDSFSQANSKGELATHTLVETQNADLLRICFENGADVNHRDEEHRTVLQKCITELSRCLDWLTWDVIESIKVCLEHGADIFVTDKCQCSCAPDGCSMTSTFGFDWNLWSGSDPVWTLEWLSLVQEFRGTEALRETLLQFLRRAAADDIGVTHLCCHRGRGSGAAARYLSPMAAEDALEILEEEEELVLKLEEEVVPFASESVDQLTSRWICFVANSHKKHLQAWQKKRENLIPFRNKSGKKQGYYVDHKKDEYHYPTIVLDVSSLNPGEISRQAASYGLWMEHELSRRKAAQIAISTGEGWYERRRFLLAELLKAAGVAEADIARRMETNNITETRTEKVDRAACARNFLYGSDKASGITKG